MMTSSIRSHDPIGVLVMAYGGPDSLDDIPGYLADIRSGRTTSPEVLEEITNNYRRIGGKSPLLAASTRQVKAIGDRLDNERFRLYLGMRHWAPWIEDVVGQMVGDGIRRAISLVLAPQFSTLSVARYHAKIEDGLEMARARIDFEHIESYHDAPKYIEALAARVRDGISRWSTPEQESVHVIFSAHSLPTRILDTGDPYDAQCRETARLAAERSGLASDRWSWCYQSAGKSPEPWLGPQIEEWIPELAATRGVRNIVCIPVGFVSDHVEILFDIDIEARAVAEQHGVRLERPPALGDDPLFIDALAERVLERASVTGWFTTEEDVPG